MKKTWNKHCGFIIKCFAAACASAGLFLLSSCGLDEYYTLTAPYSGSNISYYSTTDLLKWYYDFVTTDVQNNAVGISFSGTGVYYKIYNNYETLTTQTSAILSVNTTSNYNAAATKMIETYGYQTLNTYPSQGWEPFVSNEGTNRTVYIRLTKTGTSYLYAPMIGVYNTSVDLYNGTYLGYYGGAKYWFTHSDTDDSWTNTKTGTVSYDDITFVTPCRHGSYNTFDFFNNVSDKNNGTLKYGVKPSEGDSDYNYNSTASYDNKYFVQMYAVSIAHDSNWTMYYSLVRNLGCVPIIKD